MNGYDVALLISVIIFVTAAIGWIAQIWKKYVKHKKNIILQPLVVIAVGLTFASVIGFIPAYSCGGNAVGNAFLSAVQHTMRLFVVDDSITDVLGNITDIFDVFPEYLYKIYLLLLVIITPITTFTAILTVFARIWYNIKNRLCICRETHAFSELNERTLALAKSIVKEWLEGKEQETRKKTKRPLIVFADIIDKNEEAHLDLVDGAKEMGAILFRRDLTSIRWRWFIKRRITFYFISDDEAEKLRHAKFVMEHYDEENCNFYFFTNSYSESVESELFMKKHADATKNSGNEENAILDVLSVIEATEKIGSEINAARIKPKDAEEGENEKLKTLVQEYKASVSKVNASIASLEEKLNSSTDDVAYLEQLKSSILNSDWSVAKAQLTSKLELVRAARVKINGVRINEIRFLVYQYLYDHGAELFREAGKDKIVNATILGYGKHGKEFMKALLWYCQLPGYKVNLTVIDSDETAESRFKAEFKGLELDKEFTSSEDMRYRITFRHTAFGTDEFVTEITDNSVSSHSHFFVCFGDDNLNARACQVIQRERGRKGADLETKITAIIRNVDVKELIMNDDTEVIGDFDTYYSVKTFSADNKLIESGFAEHSSWDKRMAKEKNRAWDEKYSRTVFNFSDYSFYSSISKGLHRRLRAHPEGLGCEQKYRDVFARISSLADAQIYEAECKTLMTASKAIPKIAKKTLADFEAEIESLDASGVSAEEIVKLRSLGKDLRLVAEIEHVRWCAYVRTDGWIHNVKRNNSCKMHTDLVPVSALTCEKILQDF